MATKKILSHKLPVTRLIAVAFFNMKPEQKVIIHRADEIWKHWKHDGDRFWRTGCGRYISDISNIHMDDLNVANDERHADVILCPKCFPDGYKQAVSLLELEEAFDHQRRLDEARKELDEEQKLVAVSDSEMGKIEKLLDVNLVPDETYGNTMKYYFIHGKDGRTYKVQIRVSAEE